MIEQHLEAHQYIDTYDGWEACDCGWREEQERRFEGSIFTHAAHVAATWREARTVRTVEELDALPFLTIIREVYGPYPSGYDYGGVHERRTSGWECIAGVLRDTPNPIRLPALILWMPEVTA